jgi:hypothetical protein
LALAACAASTGEGSTTGSGGGGGSSARSGAAAASALVGAQRRGRGERGDDRLRRLGRHRLVGWVTVGALGRLEALDGGAAGPAARQVLVEAVELGERDRAVRARREQPGDGGTDPLRDDRRVACRGLPRRVEQQPLGVDAGRILGRIDRRAEGCERLGRRCRGGGVSGDLARVGENGRTAGVTQPCERDGIAVAHARRGHCRRSHARQATARRRRSDRYPRATGAGAGGPSPR